jgi:hypothetical protein
MKSVIDIERFSHLFWANLTSCHFFLVLNFIPLYIFSIYGVFFLIKLYRLRPKPPYIKHPISSSFLFIELHNFWDVESIKWKGYKCSLIFGRNNMWRMNLLWVFKCSFHCRPIYLQRWNQILIQFCNLKKNILQFNIKPYNEAIVLESFFQIFDMVGK